MKSKNQSLKNKIKCPGKYENDKFPVMLKWHVTLHLTITENFSLQEEIHSEK